MRYAVPAFEVIGRAPSTVIWSRPSRHQVGDPPPRCGPCTRASARRASSGSRRCPGPSRRSARRGRRAPAGRRRWRSRPWAGRPRPSSPARRAPATPSPRATSATETVVVRPSRACRRGRSSNPGSAGRAGGALPAGGDLQARRAGRQHLLRRRGRGGRVGGDAVSDRPPAEHRGERHGEAHGHPPQARPRTAVHSSPDHPEVSKVLPDELRFGGACLRAGGV